MVERNWAVLCARKQLCNVFPVLMSESEQLTVWLRARTVCFANTYQFPNSKSVGQLVQVPVTHITWATTGLCHHIVSCVRHHI